MARHRRKPNVGESFPHVAWKMLSTELPGWVLRRSKCSVQTTAYTGEPAYQSSQPTHSTNRTGSKLYSKELVHSKSRA